ncbi:MAG: SDR family NAD(P)-dependent oxidoreductase [Polyangiaceae bacterium]
MSKTDPSSLIVLVTGASSGIGAAVVRRFAHEGAKVIAAARRLDRLEALAHEFEGRVLPRQLDVTDSQAVSRMLTELPDGFSRISVLVNNAGAALGIAGAPAASLDDWIAMIDLNTKALVTVTHGVLSGMVERNRGHVINIGSVAGSYPYPGGNVYGGTKAFVEQFSLGLRADLLGKNIRVTNVEPGMVETEFSLVRYKGDEAKANAVYASFQPLSADDIAETVYWSATLPEHVNINRLEVMPVRQAFAGFAVKRDT